MTVETILREKGSDVVSVVPDDTIEATARLLAGRRIGAVVVCDDDGAVVGVLSERDIVRGVAQNGPAALHGPVSSLMTVKVLTCTRSHTIDDVMSLMSENRIRHVPVVDGGRLVGMISIGDVVKRRIATIEHEADTMKRYILAG